MLVEEKSLEEYFQGAETGIQMVSDSACFLLSAKLCLTAGGKLSARDLVRQPGVWGMVCARPLLLEVKT